MKTKLRKIGNSAGVTLNKAVLEDLGLEIDDPVEVIVEGNTLRIVPLNHPHQEWERWFSENSCTFSTEEVNVEESPNNFDEEDWTW